MFSDVGFHAQRMLDHRPPPVTAPIANNSHFGECRRNATRWIKAESGGDWHGWMQDRLRVLCLHGYASNVDSFFNRHAAEIRKLPGVDFVGVAGGAQLDEDGWRRAWWKYDPPYPFARS